MGKYKFEYDLDHPLRSVDHGKILKQKKILKDIYISWYNVFKSYYTEQGRFIELGSGGGFIKDIMPHVITSDVNDIPGIDQCFSALDMPFDDHSIDGIFMIDAFHHFPDVETFMKEATRVLKKQGKIVMIEPWNNWWSRFIYKNFHHELFDPDRDWKFPLQGPLSGSNMALPYIVFKRDRDILKEKFPELKIRKIETHNPFSYLLSGGFSRPPFLPSFIFPIVRYMENVKWIKNNIGMFVTIVIEKNN